MVVAQIPEAGGYVATPTALREGSASSEPHLTAADTELLAMVSKRRAPVPTPPRTPRSANPPAWGEASGISMRPRSAMRSTRRSGRSGRRSGPVPQRPPHSPLVTRPSQHRSHRAMSPLRRTMHELPVSVIEVVDGAADNGHASAGAEPTLLPAPASQSRHLTLMAADVAVPSTPQIDPVGLGVEAQLLSPGFRTPADQIIRDPTRSASPPSPIANPAGRSPDGGARPASPLELPEPPMVRESASPTPLPPAAPRRSSSAASLRSAAMHNADDASGGDASGLLPIGDIGRVGHVADDGANVGSGVEVASLAASAAIDDDGDDDGANTTGIWLPRTPETGRGRGRPAGTPGSGPTMQEIEGRLAATAMADLQAATKAANPSPPRHTPQKQSRFDVDHEAFQYAPPARVVLTICVVLLTLCD